MPSRRARLVSPVQSELSAALGALRERFDLPGAFPAEVQAAAERAAREVPVWASAELADLRGIPFLTIDPAGRWERVRTTHTHAGSNETPAAERHERTTGQLTPTQLADLRALFSSWNSLGDTYPGVADGPEWEITYGGKAVHAGSAAPAVVRAIVQSLDRIGG